MSTQRPATRSYTYNQNAFVPQAQRSLTPQERLTRMEKRYESLKEAYDVVLLENARHREDLATAQATMDESYRRGLELGHAMAQQALDELQRELEVLRKVAGVAERGIGD